MMFNGTLNKVNTGGGLRHVRGHVHVHRRDVGSRMRSIGLQVRHVRVHVRRRDVGSHMRSIGLQVSPAKQAKRLASKTVPPNKLNCCPPLVPPDI